jgi:O-antigen ligase
MSSTERLAFGAGPNGLPGLALPAPDSRESGDSIPRPVANPASDRLAYRALVAFALVLLTRPQDQLRWLEPLHLASVTGTVALVALIFGRLSRGASIIPMGFEMRAVLAFAGVMLATAPFSVWPGGAVAVFTDLFSKVIVVFAVIVGSVTTRARLGRVMAVVVGGTSYVAIRAVIDYVRGANLVEGDRLVGAVGGMFGNPNDLALNMVAILPLAIALALDRGRPALRRLAVVGIPAMALSIILSKSRGGTLGLLAMLAVLLYQMRRVRPAVAVLVIAASLAALPVLPSSFLSRMSSIYDPSQDPTGSREARKRLLREGYQAFLDNPLVGLGAGQFRNYKPNLREESWRESHNALLQVASELGIFGLIVFVVIIGSGFRATLQAGRLLRRARAPSRTRSSPRARGRRDLELYAVALVASMTGWMVAAMFASVAYYWTLYLVLGLAVSLRNIVKDEVRVEVRRGPWTVRAA